MASWLVGKVLTKLSDDLVAAYVASAELGLNAEQIKTDLQYTHGLLHEAQGRHENSGLKGLLEQLSKKADEAEDALDELHYFIIQDKLDGTQYAAPDLGGDLHEKVQHGRNAVRHTIGNWLPCFCCSRTQEGDSSATAVTETPPTTIKSDGGNGSSHAHGRNAVRHTISNWQKCFCYPLTQDGDSSATAVTETPPTTIKSDGDNVSSHAHKLTFDRVAMSNKIKSVIEGIHSKCIPVSDLLKIPSNSKTTSTTLIPTRPLKGSLLGQDKVLYGRSVIFEKTIKDLTDGTYHGETLSVLPIVGPGGIGKTTFTKHLCNDKRTKDHFAVRVWVCVSTDFDVLKLTQQIHNCIRAIEKEENNIVSATDNLDQLQISIANRLKSKRFLIVLDDIWKCDRKDEWETLLAPFTEGEVKGSMVLVTTRFPKIERIVNKATIPINLQGLDPEEFFQFFQACVFGNNKPDSELTEIGREIAGKLKCSPLAAKTVAQLLRGNHHWEHWRKVLENSEWKNLKKDDDIMPILKISFDYIPFHLKRCFSYLSLFPEDHRFQAIDINRFWTAIGIIDSSRNNSNYLEDLVENGFLMKEVGDGLEDPCYVMHDLLHELSRMVSSRECANISSFSFSADEIPESVRHLSITINDRYDKKFMLEMAKLKSRIVIGGLRTLMIFRGYTKRIDDILKDTFNEIDGLRVLFIVMESPDSLPENFSKLLHLRYLKVRSSPSLSRKIFPRIPRFYHLIFLDLVDWYGTDLPKSIGHLLNLRHFIAKDKLQSNVSEVGKLEHLEELREFHVKKERVGFELEELGKLSNLGGKLSVLNIEKVTTKEEASKARLSLKENLKILELVWGIVQPDVDADVIDGLQPHDSLRELTIINHGGAIPSWLCHNIHITHLQSLSLEGVSWVTLPPFGQLPYLKILVLKEIARVQFIGPDSASGRNQCFMHLKEVTMIDMPALEMWTIEPTCHLFPVLEKIKCMNCPKLLALPFLPDCSVSCMQDIHCPSLCSLKIKACPELLLPLMPPAPSLTYIDVSANAGDITLSENALGFGRYSGALAFHNMVNIVKFSSAEGSIASWTDLQKATSLRELYFWDDSSIQSLALMSNLPSLTTLYLLNCKNLRMDEFNTLITAVNLKELVLINDTDHPRSVAMDLLSKGAARTKQLPAGSSQLESLGVDSILAVLVAPICSSLAATLHTLTICHDQRVGILTEDEEESLQLLTSLQVLELHDCPGLRSLPQGLHSLSSLRKLKVLRCPEIQSLPKGGLPSSLSEISVQECSTELHEQVNKLRETHPELQGPNF
jgi:hypothetical protein